MTTTTREPFTTGQVTTALDIHGVTYRLTPDLTVEAVVHWRARKPYRPTSRDTITGETLTHVDGYTWERVPTDRRRLLAWLGY